jgi:hypothetical protein
MKCEVKQELHGVVMRDEMNYTIKHVRLGAKVPTDNDKQQLVPYQLSARL